MDHERDFIYWEMMADQVDQCIDIMLNHSQSGHPGGSRSKVRPLVAGLLSGTMWLDLRHPEKAFGDRFILVAGHTAPVVYALLAVCNEALRRKYQKTGDSRYNLPLGKKYTLLGTDLLRIRRRGGPQGHPEMEGKTLFCKSNTGPSGHGAPFAAGAAFALKHAGAPDVKVFAMEGEGGLTTGVTHEVKNSAYGLGLGNLIYLVDWNDFGIEGKPFSHFVPGTPRDWFEPYGWKVAGTENGGDWASIMEAYTELFAEPKEHQPKAVWFKTRKGRGYGVYDNLSHGTPHKRNSEAFWQTKEEFLRKYGLCCGFAGAPAYGLERDNERQMGELLEIVFSLFEKEPALLDYVAGRLVSIGESVPDKPEVRRKFPPDVTGSGFPAGLSEYPDELFRKPGTAVSNREGLGTFGAWFNSLCIEKYGHPLGIACSADLAGSTSVDGFAKGWNGRPGAGVYDPVENPAGALLSQGITEFANAGLMCGIVSVNFSDKPFEEFRGYLTCSSTYGSFSYLKYGPMRLYSQMFQDSQLKMGKTVWVVGHSGPDTAADGRTHFGIFAPGVTQLFPGSSIINLHPWECNEVPVLLRAGLQCPVGIVALHLTRPPVEIPDRAEWGMAPVREAARGAYLLQDYEEGKKRDGVILVQSGGVIGELLRILPEVRRECNVKIVVASSWELFVRQESSYRDSVIGGPEWLDLMIMTNMSLRLMERWLRSPVVEEYSLAPDWDERWRHGGRLDEVFDEARLSAEYQLEAIRRFVRERPRRLEKLYELLPK